MKDKIILFCAMFWCAMFTIVACRSINQIPPDVASIPKTSLEELVKNPKLAAAMLETAEGESTRFLRATNNLTEDKPQFAFQVYSVKSAYTTTDTPQPCLVVVHSNDSLTIFGLNGWDTMRELSGGYDIWYKGDAVTCTIYTANTGHVIRVNTRKMRGQLEHDELVDYVLRLIPPMPALQLGAIPNVMHGPRLVDGKVMGPIYGLDASVYDRWSKVIARAPQ